MIKMEESQGSEVGIGLTSGPSGLEQIISSKSFLCPEGDEEGFSNAWCRVFFASNILSLDVDRRVDTDKSPTNYWLAEDATGEDQGFIMSLGHSTTIHKTLQSPRLRHRHRSVGGAAFGRPGGRQASKPATCAAADVRQPCSRQLHQV